MPRSTKHDWLEGPSDLQEKDVEDVPTTGKTVRVKALAARYSNEAQTEATEVKATPDGGAVVTVNKAKMEALQLLHGLVDPKLDTVREAEMIMERFGPAVRKVIDEIDLISAIDKEAIEKAEARFPSEPGAETAAASENGGEPAAATGSGRPDVGPRTGAGAGADG